MKGKGFKENIKSLKRDNCRERLYAERSVFGRARRRDGIVARASITQREQIYIYLRMTWLTIVNSNLRCIADKVKAST